jgi:hypothetical protein
MKSRSKSAASKPTTFALDDPAFLAISRTTEGLSVTPLRREAELVNRDLM